MEKFHKFHIAKIILTALLLLITPLLSTSMRPPYLYIMVNLLIIALGAESGLLTIFTNSNRPDDQKKPVGVAMVSTMEASSDKIMRSGSITDGRECSMATVDKVPAVEKDGPVVANKVHKVVKKCPSTPSLFFIGGYEEVGDETIEEDEDEEMVDGLSGPELFTKAEMFIGNFYRQLKIQREESWKKIHGLFTKGPSDQSA